MLSLLTNQETPRKSKSNLGNGTEDVVNHRYYNTVYLCNGVRGGVVVKALRNKAAGRGFDSRRCHWKYAVT